MKGPAASALIGLLDQQAGIKLSVFVGEEHQRR